MAKTGEHSLTRQHCATALAETIGRQVVQAFRIVGNENPGSTSSRPPDHLDATPVKYWVKRDGESFVRYAWREDIGSMPSTRQEIARLGIALLGYCRGNDTVRSNAIRTLAEYAGKLRRAAPMLKRE